MSMLGNFRQISPALLTRIQAKPALIDRVLRYRPDGPPPESDRADFAARVDASAADLPDVVEAQITVTRRPKPAKRVAASSIGPADVGAELDIEKAWHGVHFLLCGSAGEVPGPLGNAVLGGTQIGPDLGYGPPRYLEPAEVMAIAAALAPLTEETLAARFDPAVFQQHEVYPGGWAADAERREWLCDAFSQLKAFYAASAEGGYAVLAYIV
jgi:hypothetical protein